MEGSTSSTSTRFMPGASATSDAPGPQAQQQDSGSQAQQQATFENAPSSALANIDVSLTPNTEDGTFSSHRHESPWGARNHVNHVRMLYSSDENCPMNDAGEPSDSLTRILISRPRRTNPGQTMPSRSSSSIDLGSSYELQPISNTGTVESDHDSLDGASSLDSLARLRVVRRAAYARSRSRSQSFTHRTVNDRLSDSFERLLLQRTTLAARQELATQGTR